MLENIIHYDQELLIFLNSLGSKQWDPFWLFITNQLHWTPLFLFVFYMIIKTYGWKQGGFLILSMIVLVAFSDQFVNLIKNSVGRLRPNNNPEIYDRLRASIYEFTNPQSKSFISGHATTSTFFTVYVILLLKNKTSRYIYLLLFFPLIFSYSRLYLGVHYPLDITLGILTGFTLANIYLKLYRKIDKNLLV